MIVDFSQRITWPQVMLLATVAAAAWKVIALVTDIVHAKLAHRFRGIPAANDRADGELRECVQRLQSETRLGFEKMHERMDAHHEDLNRRISELRREVHQQRVEVAENYVLKADHREDIKRLEGKLDRN